MARNTQVEPPPKWSSIIDPDTNRVSSDWQKWFEKVQFFMSVDNHQYISAATDIKLDAEYVQVSTTTASYAITLSAPTVPGRIKIIQMKTRTGAFDVTMALTNVTGGSAATTCTWNSASDSIVLISLYDKWLVLKENGVSLT